MASLPVLDNVRTSGEWWLHPKTSSPWDTASARWNGFISRASVEASSCLGQVQRYLVTPSSFPRLRTGNKGQGRRRTSRHAGAGDFRSQDWGLNLAQRMGPWVFSRGGAAAPPMKCPVLE